MSDISHNNNLQHIAGQFLEGTRPRLSTLNFGDNQITVVTTGGIEVSLAREIMDAKQTLQFSGEYPTPWDTEAGVGLLLGAAMEREGLVRGPLDTAVSALVRGMVE